MTNIKERWNLHCDLLVVMRKVGKIRLPFTQQLEVRWDDSISWAVLPSHWYTSQGKSAIDTDLRAWETEYADLDAAFVTTWYETGTLNEGMTWAGLIYQGFVDANLRAFLYWIGE